MLGNVICPHCGVQYEKKENLWQCPHCRQVLPVSEVKLTTLEAALCYLVEIDGKDVIGQSGRVLALMMDLMPGNQKAVRMMKSAYLATEPEIADFVKSVSQCILQTKQACTNQIFESDISDFDQLAHAVLKCSNQARKSLVLLAEPFVENLLRAFHRGFFQQDKTDMVVSALLRAYQLDPDVLLGGSGHRKVYALSHDLHMNAFARAICEVQKQNGVSVWKDWNHAASAMSVVAPQLKEETELLTCVGKHAGKEFFLLMQTIGSKNFQKGDESVPLASLRTRLKEAYIDTEAVEFFLNGILKASNLENTQPPV